jgi:hypothetical protein
MRNLLITATFLALTLITWSLDTTPRALASCSESELALGYQPAVPNSFAENNKQLLAPGRTSDADFRCTEGKESRD